MAPTGSEKRTGERVEAAFAVRLERASGVTRNVSASGLYFETQAALSVGGRINFAVDLEIAGAGMVLSCVGEIVRIDQRGDQRVGRGAQLLEPVLARDAGAARH